jgi:hypothetical protein
MAQHFARRGRDNSVQLDNNEKYQGAVPLLPFKRDILIELSTGTSVLIFESRQSSRYFLSQVVQNRKIR